MLRWKFYFKQYLRTRDPFETIFTSTEIFLSFNPSGQQTNSLWKGEQSLKGATFFGGYFLWGVHGGARIKHKQLRQCESSACLFSPTTTNIFDIFLFTQNFKLGLASHLHVGLFSQPTPPFTFAKMFWLWNISISRAVIILGCTPHNNNNEFFTCDTHLSARQTVKGARDFKQT